MSDEVTVPVWTERFPPIGYWVKVGVLIIGLIVALQVLAILQSLLVVLAASTVLAIGLQPAITWFERRRAPRGGWRCPSSCWAVWRSRSAPAC